MFGHPTVGGAVARHVADAWERKVIAEHQDAVGRRLIKQPPPCYYGLVLLSVVARLPLGMGEADEHLRNGVADHEELRLGTLSMINVPDLQTTFPIHVLYRKNGYLIGASRTLLSLISATPVRPTAAVDHYRKRKSSKRRRALLG